MSSSSSSSSSEMNNDLNHDVEQHQMADDALSITLSYRPDSIAMSIDSDCIGRCSSDISHFSRTSSFATITSRAYARQSNTNISHRSQTYSALSNRSSNDDDDDDDDDLSIVMEKLDVHNDFFDMLDDDTNSMDMNQQPILANNSVQHESTSTTSYIDKSNLLFTKDDNNGILTVRNADDSALIPRKAQESLSIYPALLSMMATAFRAQIILRIHYKDLLEYKDSFNGRHAIDILCLIMKTNDRDLALHVGRALEAQHFFHDVTYDYRLRDNPDDIYQFQRSIATKLIARNGYANGVSTFNMDDSNSNSVSSSDISSSTATINTRSVDASPIKLPNGVFTWLTNCYSPTCTQDVPCYSMSCSRRIKEQARFGSELASELKHNANRLSQHGQSQSRSQCIMTIVNELSNAASNGEQRRQEIISDIIHTEQKFMDALETIKRVYIEPFRYANIISDPIELDAFIENVFYNIPTIRQTSAQLLQALIERQNENTTVERIGDIFLAHVDKLEPFVSYAAHRPYALHHLDTAVKKYDELLRWLEERKRMPEVHGIPIHWFLAQPTARLARYLLLLEAAIKASPEGHPDRENLALAIRKIRILMERVNCEIERADMRIYLFQLNDVLSCNPKDLQVLALLDPERQLIHEGSLMRQANIGRSFVTLFLFDHYLLLVKQRKLKERDRYVVYRRPIPLRMLMTTVEDEPASTSTGLVPFFRSASGGNNTTRTSFPIKFTHLGVNGMEITLYASSLIERQEWRESIEMQCKLIVEKQMIFDSVALSVNEFRNTLSINCSTTSYYPSRLIIGTDDGVYMGTPVSTDSMIRILKLKKVHKVEILEDYNMLLVLHGKSRTLTVFTISQMYSSVPKVDSNGYKIRTKVTYFESGACMGRLLICAVRSEALYSTIDLFEPMFDDRGKKFRSSSSSRSLVKYKTFYMPKESSSVHFMQRKLCFTSRNGFEVLNLNDKEPVSLLDLKDEAFDFVVQQKDARSIAIFHFGGKGFLLCYNKFAFYVDERGKRSWPDWLVTWEGEPSAFAVDYPYILAFDSRFIEIRHVITGELEQVIPAGPLRSLSTHPDSIQYATTGNDGYHHIYKLNRSAQAIKAAIGV